MYQFQLLLTHDRWKLLYTIKKINLLSAAIDTGGQLNHETERNYENTLHTMIVDLRCSSEMHQTPELHLKHPWPLQANMFQTCQQHTRTNNQNNASTDMISKPTVV